MRLTCKHCEHFIFSAEAHELGWCKNLDIRCDGDFYCSNAAKKQVLGQYMLKAERLNEVVCNVVFVYGHHRMATRLVREDAGLIGQKVVALIGAIANDLGYERTIDEQGV